MTTGSRIARWRDPAGLALLVGIGGAVIAGALGAAVGAVAGSAAARRARAVLIAAGLALLAAAALTVFERPLTEDGIHAFADNHPLANGAGAVAGVLLLAGLAGLLLNRRRGQALRAPVLARQTPGSVGAILAATVVGVLALWLIGDHLWREMILPFASAALVVAVLLMRRRRRSPLR